MAVGYVWETLYGWVDTGTGGLAPTDPAEGLQPLHHLADAGTKRRLYELLSASGELDDLQRVRAIPVQEEDLLRVHAPGHVENMKEQSLSPKGGDSGDGVSPFGKGGYDIARLSAGGVLELTKKVLLGEIETGYALVNPPGHHATRESGMGFCMFNNISVAAAYAKERLGIERIAIVDWDVHHGNGTQDIWYGDPSVLNVSIHQNRCFPLDSGFVSERGEGDGLGYSVNVPLPPGTGDAAYLAAFNQVVVPAIKDFKPELIFIASGFDASAYDPLARQLVTTRGYQRLTRAAMDVAAEIGSRLVFAQEGGYSPHYVPFCGRAVIREMTGKAHVEDSMTHDALYWGGDTVLPHQQEIIDRANANIV